MATKTEDPKAAHIAQQRSNPNLGEDHAKDRQARLDKAKAQIEQAKQEAEQVLEQSAGEAPVPAAVTRRQGGTTLLPGGEGDSEDTEEKSSKKK